MLATLLLIATLNSFASSAPSPCTAPPGVLPVVPESLCYKEVVPVNPSGISIRDYTTSDANATFASGGGNGAFPGGVQSSIASVISYFSGANDESRNILSARTVPFAILPPKQGPYWAAFMEVSPTQFPDVRVQTAWRRARAPPSPRTARALTPSAPSRRPPQDFLIPRPNRGVSLSHVNDNIGSTLFAVFQYNTTGFPYLENIQEACGVIQNATLPNGYAINATHPWSPTYVFYNAAADANFTSECWMAAYKM